MCGIVGVVGSNGLTKKIIDGLKKLEYRGYDSSGLAFVQDKKFVTLKQEGKIAKLEVAAKKQKLLDEKLPQSAMIGHTRWATHGRPSEQNAHPHASSDVCVVHNGIIENYQELREKLQKNGAKFLSETDSEVVPHLLEMHFKETGDIKKSIIKTLQEIHGSYALAIIFRANPNFIAIAKKGSPLLVGVGENENYIASDYYALANHTNKVIYLDDEEFALVYKNQVEFFDANGAQIQKNIKVMEAANASVSKGEYNHFMLKEIHEQPNVIENILQNYVDLENAKIHLPNFPFDLTQIKKITAIACGTSYYAALSAKYLIEEIAQIEVEVDIASEFRYRSHPFRDDNLMLFISQSGETADTIAALKYAKAHGQKILSVVNVDQSSMAQLSDVVIKTLAGPEIGVASTKAYTAQIAVLSLLAIFLAQKNKKISQEKIASYILQINSAKQIIEEILQQENIRNIKQIAKTLVKSNHVLYIGRGLSYVSALEAALKLRELSYIDAQAIAAGELKHGTIALIDKKMPVIAIAPTNNLFEKIASNIEEVKARGGKIILLSSKKGAQDLKNLAQNIIATPSFEGPITEALGTIIPLQLLAYYVALYKGNDVDQPRNLAKSVTVE